MAHAFRITAAVAIAMANAFATAADAGTAAILRIYDGLQPAEPDAGVGGANLLATLTFSATAFGAGAVDGNPGGVLTAAAIASDTNAALTGTAAWFRVLTQAGGTVICDGSIGTSGADLNLNTTAIVAGATVSISAAVITMPEA